MEILDELSDLAANSIWRFVLAVVVVGVSFFLGRIVRRRTRGALGRYELDPSASALLARLSGWAVVLLGAMIGLVILGVDMVPVVIVVAIIVGLLVLSGKSLFENWGAGLLLQARGPYKIGDRIEVLDIVGFVEQTNLRSVILRTGDGQIVHIPNVEVLSNPLINRTGEEGLRRSSIKFKVAYGSDMKHAQQLLLDAAQSSDGVLTEPAPPSAWIASLGDATVAIELRFWHQHAQRHAVRSAVGQAALDALDSAGIPVGEPQTLVKVSGSLDGST